MSIYYVGIDPGLSGAVAVLDFTGNLVFLFDMPVMTKGKGTGSVKKMVNPYELLSNLQIITRNPDAQIHAALEVVNSMPGQGVSSMFSLGDTYGAIRATIACAGIALHSVTPTEWKKYFGLSRDKEVARAYAIQTYPAHADLLRRKKDVDRAEAILIATYLWKTLVIPSQVVVSQNSITPDLANQILEESWPE